VNIEESQVGNQESPRTETSLASSANTFQKERASLTSSPTIGPGPGVCETDLVRWAESLSAIARTGLGFTESGYERERFEEVLKIAADIFSASIPNTEPTSDSASKFEEWMKSVGEGVAGYVTPKLAVGAAVGNDEGDLLLIQRSDSGFWLYPTGWADVGYSPSEVVVKEVLEETGIEAEPIRLIAVFDGMRRGFSRFPFYSLVFHCRATGGQLEPHPLECLQAGWFSKDRLPSPLAGAERWVDHVFNAISGEAVDVIFDRPRSPQWRSPDGLQGED